MIRSNCNYFVGIAVAALAGAASAHDIVILPEWTDGKLSVDVKYGHPQDYQPIVPDKLFRFHATSPDGATEDWRSKLAPDAMDLRLSQAPSWRPDAGVAMLTAAYDNGYWSKDPSGVTVNTSRVHNPKTVSASHNLKYAKAFVATGADHRGYDRVVGQKLELTPLADPFAVRVGGMLPVAVRFNGRPLAGVGVEIGDSVTAIPEESIPRYRTDARGVARVPIGKAGWQVIGVDHEEKSPLPQLADKEKYTATMVFRLP